MISLRVFLLISTLCAMFLSVTAFPDSADDIPTPAPGLAYGGIPYGSMSGNVAEYFRRLAPSSGRSLHYNHHGSNVDYAPIEQYLR